jgi:hypothetical protein
VRFPASGHLALSLLNREVLALAVLLLPLLAQCLLLPSKQGVAVVLQEQCRIRILSVFSKQ